MHVSLLALEIYNIIKTNPTLHQNILQDTRDCKRKNTMKKPTSKHVAISYLASLKKIESDAEDEGSRSPRPKGKCTAWKQRVEQKEHSKPNELAWQWQPAQKLEREKILTVFRERAPFWCPSQKPTTSRNRMVFFCWQKVEREEKNKRCSLYKLFAFSVPLRVAKDRQYRPVAFYPSSVQNGGVGELKCRCLIVSLLFEMAKNRLPSSFTLWRFFFFFFLFWIINLYNYGRLVGNAWTFIEVLERKWHFFQKKLHSKVQSNRMFQIATKIGI